MTPTDPRPGTPSPVRYRTLRLCANGGGFEAVPDRRASLDLPGLRQILERAGLPVIDARVMLIVRLPPEVTISQGGRFLFKTRDPAQAQEAFGRLVGLLGLDGTLPPARGG
ncbi:MAG: hypothetical protein ACYCPN_03190 [Thermoplasmata archaeon]